MTEKLRGGIVGFGFIAERGHAPAYRSLPAFEVAAIADVCPARREIARAAFPSARIYANAEELVADKELDFVDVCTPPADHAKVALMALDRGLHVLCEKPLATTLEDARAMLAKARSARRTLFACHNYRHSPVVKAVRRVLDEGQIGDVRLVTLQTFRNTHAKGVPEWRTDWRREKKYSGGGIAMDHGSHTFYLAFDWLGAYPTAITARMSTIGDWDTEDNFACSIAFPTGTASAHLSWTAGCRKVIYTLHGERGAIRVEDDDLEVTVARGSLDAPTAWDVRKSTIASHWKDASHVEWFASLFETFWSAVLAGEYVGRDAEDGLRSVELITRAYASATSGSRELALAPPEPAEPVLRALPNAEGRRKRA
jgi:predicted dehydrogenase